MMEHRYPYHTDLPARKLTAFELEMESHVRFNQAQRDIASNVIKIDLYRDAITSLSNPNHGAYGHPIAERSIVSHGKNIDKLERINKKLNQVKP